MTTRPPGCNDRQPIGCASEIARYSNYPLSGGSGVTSRAEPQVSAAALGRFHEGLARRYDRDHRRSLWFISLGEGFRRVGRGQL